MALSDFIKRMLGQQAAAQAENRANAEAQSIAAKDDRRNKPRVEAKVGTRILVIDDSTTILAVMKRMLMQNSFEVIEAIDAEKGIESAFANSPDLIFLDIVLPGMDGFTALRILRRDPRTRLVPIIMMSGNEQATEQFYVQRIGADDFMKKPFSRPEVFTRINKLIDENGVPRRQSERG